VASSVRSMIRETAPQPTTTQRTVVPLSMN
jgi:hypothetical protein